LTLLIQIDNKEDFHKIQLIF